jgi:oligoribonuclease NrnB/cAMP/cGMP phosphodiesterase (DHH superfamily)
MLPTEQREENKNALKSKELQAQSIIITHGDVDGMVCAAQIIRREKTDWDVQFSNARYIKSKLRKILKLERLPKRIYITDIPANIKATELVEQLAKNGVEVFWIDHHPWPGTALAERLKQTCTCVVYNESMSTPAGVLVGRL